MLLKTTIKPPFTRRIMEEPLPANFKTPSVNRFDGVGDLQGHILYYQDVMMLMEANDVLMCRALIFLPSKDKPNAESQDFGVLIWYQTSSHP